QHLAQLAVDARHAREVADSLIERHGALVLFARLLCLVEVDERLCQQAAGIGLAARIVDGAVAGYGRFQRAARLLVAAEAPAGPAERQLRIRGGPRRVVLLRQVQRPRGVLLRAPRVAQLAGDALRGQLDARVVVAAGQL